MRYAGVQADTDAFPDFIQLKKQIRYYIKERRRIRDVRQ